MNRGSKRNAAGKAVIALRVVAWALAGTVAACALLLAWLRWDAGRARDHWWQARHGTLVFAETESLPTEGDRLASAVRLRADTGLAVELRVLRPADSERPVPVLVILGGHRTGRDAVELIGDPAGRAVVALDYPYDGPHRLRGLWPVFAALPAVRRAFLDTPPALWLTLDWLEREPWADRDRIVMIGVSLGVPFAAAGAAQDERFSALALVHGAADNRRWLELNLSRRLDAGVLEGTVATVFNWLIYGPLYDTPRHVAAVSPRPVLIVGAREDERVPAGAPERLFEAAREPKSLRYTEGLHVRPGRTDIIEELLAIAQEELSL